MCLFWISGDVNTNGFLWELKTPDGHFSRRDGGTITSPAAPTLMACDSEVIAGDRSRKLEVSSRMDGDETNGWMKASEWSY